MTDKFSRTNLPNSQARSLPQLEKLSQTSLYMACVLDSIPPPEPFFRERLPRNAVANPTDTLRSHGSFVPSGSHGATYLSLSCLAFTSDFRTRSSQICGPIFIALPGRDLPYRPGPNFTNFFPGETAMTSTNSASTFAIISGHWDPPYGIVALKSGDRRSRTRLIRATQTAREIDRRWPS
jgi:hypothetical protein